jgi:twitching motility protein PilT
MKNNSNLQANNNASNINNTNNTNNTNINNTNNSGNINNTRSKKKSEGYFSKERFDKLLGQLAEYNIADVIFSVGTMPHCRTGNKLVEYKIERRLSATDTFDIASILLREKDIDLEDFDSKEVSYDIEGVARFRASIFKVQGKLRVVMRIIPRKLRSFKELNLPEEIEELACLRSGLVLVTGKNRQGKSTTIAALIEKINKGRSGHIISLENPIEYLHQEAQCLISQREIDEDIKNYNSAVRAALRQSADVIMIGEIRDAETFEAALYAAETGQLVISSIHADDVTKTFERIINYYSAQERKSICSRLSNSLQTVITQRLLPMDKEKDSDSAYDLIPAVEIFHMSPGIKKLISEDEKLPDIVSYIEKDGKDDGMQSFDMHIKKLFQQGLISEETVKANATDPEKVFRECTYQKI